jgi:hypothetical protein
MKRAGLLKLKIVAALSALITSFSLQSAQAAQFITTINSACVNYGMDSAWQAMQPFTVPAATTVTSAQWKMWNTVAPTGAQIRFYSDSSGTPSSTLLGTLVYSSWSSPISTFTGSVSFATAGTYWIRFSSTIRADPCYVMAPVTTGSASGWTLPSIYSHQSANGGASFFPRADYLSFLFTLFGTGGGTAPTATSISLSAAQIGTYNQPLNLTAALAVAGSDGRVSFFANNKRIPGCTNKSSSALSVTCSWRPSRRGSVSLTARLTPTDSGFASSLSPAKNILVSNRVGLR